MSGSIGGAENEGRNRKVSHCIGLLIDWPSTRVRHGTVVTGATAQRNSIPATSALAARTGVRRVVGRLTPVSAWRDRFASKLAATAPYRPAGIAAGYTGALPSVRVTGNRTRTVVPAPGELRSSIWPPSASARSLRPTSPVPPVKSAPPTPSSATSMSKAPRAVSWSTVTVMVSAWECLAAFVNASATV